MPKATCVLATPKNSAQRRRERKERSSARLLVKAIASTKLLASHHSARKNTTMHNWRDQQWGPIVGYYAPPGNTKGQGKGKAPMEVGKPMDPTRVVAKELEPIRTTKATGRR